MTDIEDDITSAVQQDWRPVYPNGPAGPAVAPLPLDHNLNPKDAIGRTKASVWAVPPTAVLYMGAALQDGAGKYGLFNWRDSAIDIGIYFDALFRHMCEFRDGEILDEKSKLPHMAHIAANAAIILDAMESGNYHLDMGSPGPVARTLATLAKWQEERS
jgi:hypothetical protein